MFVILIITITYLSIFGIETDRFNTQIKNKIKNIDNKTEIKLDQIKLVLEPFKFKINIKTLGTKLKNQGGIIEIESLKTHISLKTLLKNKLSIENLEVSTKSIEINNLISFIRFFYNTPELFILEKVIKNGYLIADIKLEFDSDGKIKDNYKIKGILRETKLSILKKYDFQKLNLIFRFKKNDLLLNDIAFSINDQNLISENISIKKEKDDFLISGKLNNEELDINERNLNIFIKPFFPKIDFTKLRFSSNNDFSFKINKKIEFKDFVLNSEVLIDEILIINKLDLKDFFSKINKDIYLSKHKLSIRYANQDLSIKGKGNVLLQEVNDIINYSINKNSNILNFETLLRLDNNSLNIDFLNYQKKDKNKTLIKLEGAIQNEDLIFIKLFSINEKKNKINFENFHLNSNFEITKLGSINLDYIDRENKNNLVKLYSKKDKHYLDGTFFNANKLINNLLFSDKNSNFININNRININIDKIYLDNEYDLSNFTGNIFFENKEITKANLVGTFTNDKRFEFTVTTKGKNKITTLFMDRAEPVVKRYKFIKGFNEGILDFYSSKVGKISDSTLKIYDFKLKELPVLTKILTLASLQGVADILSGEGIRFDDFEMNFKNEGRTMTINEIYAIGPAISILMDGYVEKDKTLSLRGTLVPATTINKFIGSIPVLGKLLVGTKTGEGVFGVSFKIKGPPKNLVTSVNPIKTLTPRFITRTLEKIKKN